MQNIIQFENSIHNLLILLQRYIEIQAAYGPNIINTCTTIKSTVHNGLTAE